MNVLLINPKVSSALQAAKTIYPPLGLLYVAAVLRDGGHDVRVMDMSIEEEEKPDFSSFDLVGLSGTTTQIGDSLAFAREAKAAGKTVVMGGPHSSFMAEELLSTGWVDYIVRGEGELTALELVNRLEGEGKNFDPGKVLGISWRDAETGQVVANPPRPFIRELDGLPLPARDLMNMEAYKVARLQGLPCTSILTSRGCPYDCSFCCSTQLTGYKWRRRSAKLVVDEIQLLVERYGFGSIAFVDDNMAINVPRAKEMCDEIIRRRLNIKWWGMCSADPLAKSEELLAKMAASGCDKIFIGLESPDPKVLASYNKRASVEVGERAVRLLKKHGIKVMGAFILGEMSETEEDINLTIRYPKKLKLESAQFAILTPYPGTRLFYELQDRLITRDWSKYDGIHAVYRPDLVTPERLERLLKKAWRNFYLDPVRLIKRGLSLETILRARAILKTI